MTEVDVFARIRKKIQPSVVVSGIANEVGPDEVIWAMGIEQEGTYVLNPLDTEKDWKTSFKKMYIPDYYKIHQWVNKSEDRKKKYPFLAEDDTIESSGRFCGKYVVYGDPIDSLLEISTRQAYGTHSMLPHVEQDILWYPVLCLGKINLWEKLIASIMTTLSFVTRRRYSDLLFLILLV